MGGYISNLWWSGNPDAPNPDSGLSRRDIYAIQRSWSPMYSKAGSYGLQLFTRLFQKDPTTKSFFKAIRDMDVEQISNSVQFRAHVINLMSSINTAVVNLHQPEVVMALMNKLGETHNARHVDRRHFFELREIWVDFMKEDLQFNENLLNSWIRFINFIYKYILDKLNDE